MTDQPDNAISEDLIAAARLAHAANHLLTGYKLNDDQWKEEGLEVLRRALAHYDSISSDLPEGLAHGQFPSVEAGHADSAGWHCLAASTPEEGELVDLWHQTAGRVANVRLDEGVWFKDRKALDPAVYPADKITHWRPTPNEPTGIPTLRPYAYLSVNNWFLTLPEGRQARLRDDKWALADAAFAAARKER